MTGYLRTLRNYLRTAKGRHDFFDYLRAALIILAASLIVGVVIWL